MRLTITEDLYDIICDNINEKLMKSKNKDERDSLEKTLRELRTKVIGKVDVVDKIIKHAKVLYRNDKIEFDIQYLLGFDNCVYDLDTYKFRDYRHDDFVSITTGLTWREPTEEESETIDSFFEKFQPNHNVRKLVLILLATCLEPKRLDKFPIFTGNGANAKSVLIALLKLMLGNLSFSATSAILWQPKGMGGCPEVANLNKKRCVPI